MQANESVVVVWVVVKRHNMRYKANNGDNVVKGDGLPNRYTVIEELNTGTGARLRGAETPKGGGVAI